MAASIELKASLRPEVGRDMRDLRRRGSIPAVLYGHQLEPMSLSADLKLLEKVWRTAGRTHLVDLIVDGEKPRKVLIRDLQRDPRTTLALHADFFAVNLKEKLTVDTPLVIVGDAPAVTEFKVGQLLQIVNAIKIECLPSDLPAHLEIDVTGLNEIDDHVQLKDVKLPHGVTLVHADIEEIVAKIVQVRVAVEEEPVAAETAETTEAAEGETPTDAKPEGSE